LATQAIKDLLLEAGPFARLSAMEQRTRLVMYYQPWFLGDFKIDTVNNIRSVQRLTTHAKLMGLAVGVVLQAILEEASGRSPAPAVEPVTRGLEIRQGDLVSVGRPTNTDTDVEVGPVSISQVGLRGSADTYVSDHPDEGQGDPAEPVAAAAPPPAPSRPRSRSNRVK